MEIRDARPEDAAAACAVLRRSISELCAPDHGGDAAVMAMWLANKTPEIVAGWIRQSGTSLLLAVEDDAILGVGSVTDTGEITLNYVSPEARFQGVSKTLVAALERRARERGSIRCTLSSTKTARRFYLDAGYTDNGTPQCAFGMLSCFPMAKRIDPS